MSRTVFKVILNRLPAVLLALNLAGGLIVGSAVPVAAQGSGDRLDVVERRALINQIQRELIRLGCYEGNIRGRIDQATLAAISRLRKAVGRNGASARLVALSRPVNSITGAQFGDWVDYLRSVKGKPCGGSIEARATGGDSKARRAEQRREREAKVRAEEAERQREQSLRMRSAEQERAARPVAPQTAPSGPVGGRDAQSVFPGRARAYVAPPRPIAEPRGGGGGSDVAARSAPVPETAAPPTVGAPAPPSVPRLATRSARGAASPPPTPTEPYDIVPVFYGTDRLREDDAKRAKYGSTRAKRLELGQALITVPKLHEKPLVERPWVYRLPFTGIVVWSEKEDPSKHFTIRNARVLEREQLIDLVKQRLGASTSYKDHALVFIHGFNTPFDFALYRAAQISYDLKFDGAMFAYSFPSRGEISPTAYSYDRESAGQAQGFLEDFLKLVTRETGAKTVSIIAHSMGNQLLLPVLKDLQRTAPPDLKISQIILAAPDVDRDNFEVLAAQIAGASKGFTLYAAANDWALRASQRFWGNVPRAGDVPAGTGPVVVAGIDTIDVTKTSTEFLSLGHNGYAEKSALLNDIELLIRTGERPPELRFPILTREKTSAGGVYWRYP